MQPPPRSAGWWVRPPSGLRAPGLLPACVEIMLAADGTAQARDGRRELAEIAEEYRRDGVLGTMTVHAPGAVELVLSGRVDRHVSNIITKLGVPSRTAATAYMYQHQLG